MQGIRAGYGKAERGAAIRHQKNHGHVEDGDAPGTSAVVHPAEAGHALCVKGEQADPDRG